MAQNVNIPVGDDTRSELDRLRSASSLSYDALVRRLLELVPKGDDEGEYTDAFRFGLLEAELDRVHGKTVSHADLKKRLGL